MNIRSANQADTPAIRDVARRSLEQSYSLSPQAISTAIEEWYDEAEMRERFETDERLLLVAERDGQVVGLSESVYSESGDDATLLWLHVDPAYRDGGVAAALLDGTIETLEQAGFEHIYGRVLQDNADGNAFYDRHGFEQVAEETVEIAGRTHVENVWAFHETSGVEPLDTDDGTRVFVNYTEFDTGSAGHFYPVYSDEESHSLYGYYCGNCDHLANAMDAMGRIECDNCGNTRKPTRWDAAYL